MNVLIAGEYRGAPNKNSGKRRRASYVPSMAHPADPLTELPHDERIRSRKVSGGVATIIADATGLSDAERQSFEEDLRVAALNVPGVNEARVALTAAQPLRTLIAIGSGKGGVGKSTVPQTWRSRWRDRARSRPD